jgi:(1->4)-alpha-D-glucan 1-alpha-D-glucosylmutase
MFPTATYRLQFGKNFGFDDAAAVAPYLAKLGISHVYASPYLQARANSEHGYDVIDHNALNSELGGYDAFRRMTSALREHGLGQILDCVPNHMGVGGADNPWWLDVLEWGRESKYAAWFDIDWDAHPEYLNGKLLVPFLGEQYGAVLRSGQIELKSDAERGEFSVWLYGTHKLPVSPLCYAEILGKTTIELERMGDEFSAVQNWRPDMPGRAAGLKAQLAELTASNEGVRAALEANVESFRGNPGSLDSWSKLDGLIRKQHWRAAYFRVAADDINYRRFFNINELAGIRMELPEVFEHTHRLVFELLRDGTLQGLRIDHVDGLFDPRGYLERLRARGGAEFYLVVEKILGRHESLRNEWPVQGTTGYEFCNQVTELLVNRSAEETLTTFYREFTGETQEFPAIVRQCKIKILENEMGSELEALARDAVRVARQNPSTTDFTQNILRRALKEVIACFPVYRTYVDGAARNETDRRYIHWGIAQATKNEEEIDRSVFEFLEKLLGGELAEDAGSGFSRTSVVRFAMKAQQASGPVMAKGLEDTALYRYNRFVALNEVGSAPGEFGGSLAAFHKGNQQRAESWPATLLATATHDTKHGEDARARLGAVSLVAEEWTTKVTSWSRILRARRGDVEGTAPPARNDEYLFFQNLIATWPAELTLPRVLDDEILDWYVERVQAAMIKAIREARVRSNWILPDEKYELAVSEYIRDALNRERSEAFFENFLPFQQRVAQMGVHNSLVQLALKITSPGVGDFYQGGELWDLSFADPDNRRPVDFGKRCRLLREIEGQQAANRAEQFAEYFQNWHDGRVKLALSTTLLRFRRENAELFASGAYEPLRVGDGNEESLCAYLRSAGQEVCLVVAALDGRLQAKDYRECKIDLGARAAAARWRNVVTGVSLYAVSDFLPVEEILSDLPVAVLSPIW